VGIPTGVDPMSPRFTRLLPALALVLPMAAMAQAPAPAATRPKPAQLPKDSMEIGRRFAQWLLSSTTDSLISHIDASGKTPDELAAMRRNYEQTALQVAARAGTEVKVLEEKYITRNGMRQYWRTSEFSNMTEPLVIRFIVGEKGQLLGSGVNPKSQTPPIDP
jgi:hypothetical protein